MSMWEREERGGRGEQEKKENSREQYGLVELREGQRDNKERNILIDNHYGVNEKSGTRELLWNPQG